MLLAAVLQSTASERLLHPAPSRQLSQPIDVSLTRCQLRVCYQFSMLPAHGCKGHDKRCIESCVAAAD